VRGKGKKRRTNNTEKNPSPQQLLEIERGGRGDREGLIHDETNYGKEQSRRGVPSGQEES